MKKKFLGKAVLSSMMVLMGATSAMALTGQEKLGQMLYFDKYLSLNHNQSCASCHHPAAGWADPLNAAMPDVYPVSLGSDRNLNGCRNAPPSGYAAFTPLFDNQMLAGGQFWDGRADTLKDQAKGPFLNPVEMGMPDEAAVIAAIADRNNPKSRAYQTFFRQVYGVNLSKIDYTNNALILDLYDKVAEAIGSFEQTKRLTSFTSKYDYYLAGMTTLSDQEMAGLALFEGKGGCNACHPSAAQVNTDATITPPLFTDFTYDNLGVPKSSNVLLTDCPTDLGLGGRINDPAQDGKFKVSSLRNVEMSAPYAHNGYFATLADIVHFYNTREDGTWPGPEVAANVNYNELGNLGLTVQEEADLVAFLQTLTDGFEDKMPRNFVPPSITPLP
ncbi:MAG: cytochrome-c peroxidase [Deltaproteobacteria bacterium]|nr:cytochrome-c peroxidase [Deltaproteobacteria bacterium]